MIPVGPVFMNATLTSDPTIEEDYLAMPFDGTFFTDSYSEKVQMQTMPIHRKDGKAVQVSLSEQSFNSMLRAFHDENQLNFEQQVP